jgi:hypothetical protein
VLGAGCWMLDAGCWRRILEESSQQSTINSQQSSFVWVVSGMSPAISRNLDTPFVSGISKTHSRNNLKNYRTIERNSSSFCNNPEILDFPENLLKNILEKY